MEKSRRIKIIILAIVLIATFFLVYTPHYQDAFPKHIDEWHHITESMKLKEGGYTGGSSGFEFGFHVFLLPFYLVLGTKFVLFYKFLPAIWACFSSLALFFLVYKKTGNNFLTAILAMVFFASIKSNVNITGLWFFTPLTFAIPFIYLYIYFFTEGIEKKNKRFVLASLAIMAFLIPVHAISVLFAIPFLFVYALLYYKYLKQEWKFFSIFLLIPLTGILFYKFTANVLFSSLIKTIANALQFRHGWGILEVNIPFTLLYNPIGLILAGIGIISIFLLTNKEKIKKYSVFILWLIATLIPIIAYKFLKVSYLVPYQRNLYYFALSLPILSAFGMYYLMKFTDSVITSLNESEKIAHNLKIMLCIIAVAAVFFFAFKDYTEVPNNLKLYTILDEGDYDSLIFLKEQEKSTVMANPAISEAIYPVSLQKPVATLAFYGNRKDSEAFLNEKNCSAKQILLDKYHANYILSKTPINCGWKVIYNKTNYIYKAN